METKKRRSICYGLVLVFCTICGLLSVVFSGDASAASIGTSSFDLHYIPYPSNDTYQWENNILYGSPTSRNRPVTAIDRYQWNTPSIYIEGTQAVIHFETNIVQSSFSSSYDYSRWEHLDSLTITSCSVNGNSSNLVSKSISSVVTPWTSIVNNLESHNYTLTIYGDLVISGLTKNSYGVFTCAIGTPDSTFYRLQGALPSDIPVIWFEQNPMRVTYVDNVSDALLQMQNNLIQQQIDTETQAYDNISGQSASDIQGAENQQTTNLIGVLSSFLTELRSFQPTNCNLTLPLPEFVGGETTVNICQGKDVLGNFITIVGTLTMVTFYIPLAYLLIKMIYNEIRSFTNG